MRRLVLLWLLGVLVGCASPKPGPRASAPALPERGASPVPAVERGPSSSALPVSERGREVVMYALGLIDVDYRFGGKNPSSGLDCSGMVTYIYRQAAGIALSGNAARLAQLGRAIEASQLRPGDLVFFNTQNRSFSHVGIYIGDDRFIHAPSTNGKIMITSLKSGWFAQRFEAARTLLD